MKVRLAIFRRHFPERHPGIQTCLTGQAEIAAAMQMP